MSHPVCKCLQCLVGGFFAVRAVNEPAAAIRALDFPLFFRDIEKNAGVAERPAAAIAGGFVGVGIDGLGHGVHMGQKLAEMGHLSINCEKPMNCNNSLIVVG